MPAAFISQLSVTALLIPPNCSQVAAEIANTSNLQPAFVPGGKKGFDATCCSGV